MAMSSSPSPSPDNRLPAELVSLVHHAELHRSGWWDRALERIVIVSIWLRGPTTVDDVLVELGRSLEGRIDRERLEMIVERARAAGVVVDTHDGKLKTSEEQSQALSEELADVTKSEKRVWERLTGLAASAGITADPAGLWDDFEDLFMVPLVKAAGARMYDVLTSSIDIDVAVPTYRDVIDPLSAKYGNDIRQVLVDFLDPANLDVRNYVLRTLNGDFLRESVGLDVSHLKALRANRGSRGRMQVLVDTNFLFSFLRLHDNPSNGVAEDLIDLIGRAEDSLEVELRVLPITVEETRRVLREVMFRLSGVVLR